VHCPHFEAARCTSCSEIRQPYAAQLGVKQLRAELALNAHPDVHWLPPIGSRDSGFRNKAKMAVAGTHDAPILGIVNARGAAVDLRDCLLYPPSFQPALAAIAEWISLVELAPYDLQTRRGELKYVLLTEAPKSALMMLRLVLRSRASEARIRKHLSELLDRLPLLKVVSLNIQPEHKAILEGEVEIVLSEQRALKMQLGNLTLQLGQRAFFQTNSDLANRLYEQVGAWVDELQPSSVWDLFCGVGGFALKCAKPGRAVLGVEISADALDAAREAATLMGLSGVQFLTLDAAAFTDDPAECVIVNPPRRGIGRELSARLELSRTRWLIYSSCNVASLAQDLSAMPAFKLKRARMLDMFPHTTHFEVVVLLERR